MDALVTTREGHPDSGWVRRRAAQKNRDPDDAGGAVGDGGGPCPSTSGNDSPIGLLSRLLSSTIARARRAGGRYSAGTRALSGPAPTQPARPGPGASTHNQDFMLGPRLPFLGGRGQHHPFRWPGAHLHVVAAGVLQCFFQEVGSEGGLVAPRRRIPSAMQPAARHRASTSRPSRHLMALPRQFGQDGSAAL